MPATLKPGPVPPAAPGAAEKKRFRIPLPRPALPSGARAAALLWQSGAAAAGFLLAGGRLAGGAAPFALGYLLGCTPGYALAGALGAAVGSLLLLPAPLNLNVLAALAGVLAMRLWRRDAFGPAACAAAGLLAAGQAVTLLRYGLSAATPLQAALTAAAAILLGRVIRALPVQTPRGALLWTGMAVACIQHLPLFGLMPGLCLLTSAGLTAAWAGATVPGTACLLWAAALAVAEPALCGTALAAAAALLAAAVAGGGRRKMAGVAAAGFAVLLPLLPRPQAPLAALCSAALGAALFAVLPGDILRALLPDTAGETPARPAGGAATAALAARVAAVADALADVGDTVRAVCAHSQPPRGESFNYVVDYTARRLCQSCQQRERCWIRSYSGMVDGLYHLKTPLETRGRVEIEDLQGMLTACARPSDLCRTVSHGYRLWRSRRQGRARTAALRTALTGQYEAIAEALARMAVQLERADLPDPPREAKTAQLFAELGLDALECSVVTDLYGRMRARVTVARTAFTPEELAALAQELGRACRRDLAPPEAHSHHAVTTLLFAERPLFRAEFGAANRPAAGQTVSGDAWEQFCDASGRAQLLLCDGMGVGAAAAVDGQMAARLTAQLLRAGIGAESSVQLVNTALGLKNTEQESGATLDLWTVDLYTGRAVGYKAGAAPSFLLRAGVPRLLEAGGLPIGILDTVTGHTAALTLEAGDTLVLASDGLLTDGPDWLLQQLAQGARRGLGPAALAQAVVQAAAQRPSAARDDCTLLAVQLTEP